ncbi:flagellar biosynthesis anti-sigma factor FlgM [Sphingomonas oleivorans]|nr:flagellar biosynthesis anti-sigma factor FlgM [Sphingomonas oleivorans]
MINGIGPSGPARVEPLRSDGIKRGEPTTPVSTARNGMAKAATSSPAADLAASGPPIDSDKIAAIRAAIANGSYRIDPQAIASKMVDLDLPSKPA